MPAIDQARRQRHVQRPSETETEMATATGLQRPPRLRLRLDNVEDEGTAGAGTEVV